MLSEEPFNLASFCTRIGATIKERNAIRQDLVRGLKDYFEFIYGYDRYGAETILHLPEHMAVPQVYGYGALRIMRDRRISEEVKVRVAQRALDVLEYGKDRGMPFGLFAALHFLARQDRLTVDDLRYGLVASAGEITPFRGLESAESVGFFRRLLANAALPVEERLFWGHLLIAHHQDDAGATELVNSLLGCADLPVAGRRELGRAWIHCRQPRLAVDIPQRGRSERGDFVVDHMGFWVAHAPSWPSTTMVRLGLIWLARLGENPLELASTYIVYRDVFADQLHTAVVDIIAEHHEEMPRPDVRSLIEQGIRTVGSSPIRRKFYRLGTDLFGREYLERAAGDTANSVRQWAARQLQKQA